MIVVDVEASGLDPHRHSMVSVGAVDLYQPSNRFYQECRVWEGAELDPTGLAINGQTPEAVLSEDRPTLKQTMQAFLAWALAVPKRTLVGQNPSFDRDMLQTSAERYGLTWPLHHRTVDLHSVCFAHMLSRGVEPPLNEGVTALGTDLIHAYAGVPDEPKPHNALNGALWEAETFSRIVFGKLLLEEFAEHSVPEYLSR